MSETQHIVRHIQQGDREAMGQLYTAWRYRLRALCLHYVPDEAVADDLLHDAFVLIFSHIDELNDTAKAAAWMKRVTRNVCLLYLRDQKQHDAIRLSESEAAYAVASEPAPVSYDEIMQMIDQLPEGYRQVFRLSVLEGMSHQQIADLLHIDPHSSSSQLFRARTILRRMLRPLVFMLLILCLPIGIYRLLQKEQTPSQPTRLAKESSRPSSTAIALFDTVSTATQAEKPHARPSSSAPAIPATTGTPADSVAAEAKKLPEQPLTAQADVEAKPEVQAKEQPTPSSMVTKQRGEATNGWTLDLAYSGLDRHADMQLPYADIMINDIVYDSLTHHSMPLTLSLSLHYRLNDHWQVGTGVQYTQLNSETRIGNTFASLRRQQHVRYWGIPVSLSWHQSLASRFSVYSKASVTMHLPLHATLESVYLLSGQPVDPATERLHPGVQWSVGLSVGAQYQLTPYVSLFAEPGLQHFFQNGSGVETWNTAHSVTFSLPFGLRLSW